MNFGPQHYVPVLKVKRGEKKALTLIAHGLQHQIIPLLEIVERRPDQASTIDKHLKTAFKGLADSTRPYPRCFLDAREIAPDGPEGAREVFRRAASDEIAFTPVTGASRTVDVDAALEHSDHGIALRLTREEFEAGSLPTVIETFMVQHGLNAEQVDLIIDLGGVETLVADGITTLATAFLADVPYHHRWRTFTISACAFPRSMRGIDRHSYDLVAREEWIAWRDYFHPRRNSLQRLPTFSDCAIQHPSGVEGFDPRIMQVSATIRYTLSDNWLLIKGESTRFTRPGEQFPELATRLVYGQHSEHFAGPNHCGGCESMKSAADGVLGFGSAEVWRRLGTVHHISTATESLGSLPWT